MWKNFSNSIEWSFYFENSNFDVKYLFEDKIVNILDNTQNCPNCWEEFIEWKWCENCWYQLLLSWEITIWQENLDYYDKIIKKDSFSIKKLIILEKKLNNSIVKYLNNPNILNPEKSLIYLTIWDRKYKIGFKYDIFEYDNHDPSDNSSYKIAKNLKILFIQIKNRKTYKKSFVYYFQELSDFITHEILNNKDLNHKII